MEVVELGISGSKSKNMTAKVRREDLWQANGFVYIFTVTSSF